MLKFIPDDKAWVMRQAMLALNTKDKTKRQILINKMVTVIRQKNRANDIMRAADVLEVWESGKPVNVGESGTLYRYFTYRDFWEIKNGITKKPRKFITSDTLVNRSITRDSKIIEMSQTELLKLDNGTSQYASAAVLMGDPVRLPNLPDSLFRLQQTYDMVDEWFKNGQEINPQNWQPIPDITITKQAEAYIKLLDNSKLEFEPKHGEDVPFAIAFNLITPAEAAKQFPSILGHETNRVTEMEKEMKNYLTGDKIDSKDHRVVQAFAMLGKYQNNKVVFTNQNCVAKSWPEFWNFLNDLK